MGVPPAIYNAASSFRVRGLETRHRLAFILYRFPLVLAETHRYIFSVCLQYIATIETGRHQEWG